MRPFLSITETAGWRATDRLDLERPLHLGELRRELGHLRTAWIHTVMIHTVMIIMIIVAILIVAIIIIMIIVVMIIMIMIVVVMIMMRTIVRTATTTQS